MKLEELKDWNTLSKVEQDRLRRMYGKSPDITKTIAQRAKSGKHYRKDRRLAK